MDGVIVGWSENGWQMNRRQTIRGRMGGTDQRHANRRTRGEPHRPTHTTHSTPQNVPWLKKGYERSYERSLTPGSIGYNTVGESSGRGGDRDEGMMTTGRSALPPVLLLRARPDGASEAATNRPRDDVGGSLRGLWVCRCRACGVRRGMKKKEEEKEEQVVHRATSGEAQAKAINVHHHHHQHQLD